MAEHGTTTRYRGGCRCEACRSANREYCRAYAEANAEAISERMRAYRGDNRDVLSAKRRERYWENRAEESAQRQNVSAERRAELNAAQRRRYATTPNIEEYRRLKRAHSTANRAAMRRREKERNDISRDHANRNGFAWEGWEDRHLLDRRRTATELALALGRTIYAVTLRRRELRRRNAL